MYPIILSPSARPRQAVISPVPSVTEADSQSTEPLLPASRTWQKVWGASASGRRLLEQCSRRACATLAFSRPQLRNFGVCLQVLEIMKKAAVNIRVQALCERRFSFLLIESLGVGSLVPTGSTR